VAARRQEFSGCRQLRGGAGRTRTNNQSVMEHGSCPTNSPGRTPIQIAGRFTVLLDFPGFLVLDQPPECYGTWFESDQLPWSDAHPDGQAFVVLRDYPSSWSASNEQPDFLRKAVRVRPAYHVGLTLHFPNIDWSLSIPSTTLPLSLVLESSFQPAVQ